MISPQTILTARQQLEKFLNICSKDTLLQAFTEFWLNDIAPGIRDLIGCDQGSRMHLEGDVAIHTALVFDNIKSVARNRLGREPDFIERFSAVIHDWRKPSTRQPEADGNVSFPGHEAKAAEGIPGIAKTLGLSGEETTRLVFLVARHGDAHSFLELSQPEQSELNSSPWITSLALLQEADARSCVLLGGGHLPIYWNELVGIDTAK